HVVAHVSQRMLAPGAEEFLPPATVGPWLPPERTFAALGGEDLRVERTRAPDVARSLLRRQRRGRRGGRLGLQSEQHADAAYPRLDRLQLRARDVDVARR